MDAGWCFSEREKRGGGGAWTSAGSVGLCCAKPRHPDEVFTVKKTTCVDIAPISYIIAVSSSKFSPFAPSSRQPLLCHGVLAPGLLELPGMESYSYGIVCFVSGFFCSA